MPTPETLRIAQEAAERSIVLLKNDDRMLPIGPAAQRVLLTGPYATSTDHLGAWVQHFGAEAGSLDDALRAALPDATWTVAPGADFLEPSDGDIREAARLAGENDLVVIAVGEPSSISGEASSRADIRLPGDQERLIHAIADTGVPFIVLLATGRPLVVEDWIDRAPTVLLTWHLGTRGPEAIARVVAGAVNPGGRVPMTFPRAVGQIPIHHDAESTGRPARTGGSMSADRWDVGLQGPNNLDDYYTSKFLDLERGTAVLLRARAELHDVPRGGGIPLDSAGLARRASRRVAGHSRRPRCAMSATATATTSCWSTCPTRSPHSPSRCSGCAASDG